MARPIGNCHRASWGIGSGRVLWSAWRPGLGCPFWFLRFLASFARTVRSPWSWCCGRAVPTPVVGTRCRLAVLSVSAVPSACLPVCRRPFSWRGVCRRLCLSVLSFCLFVFRRSCVSGACVSVGRRVREPSSGVCAVLSSAKVRNQPRCWPLPFPCASLSGGGGFPCRFSCLCFGLGPLLFSGRCAARCSGCLGCSGWGPPVVGEGYPNSRVSRAVLVTPRTTVPGFLLYQPLRSPAHSVGGAASWETWRRLDTTDQFGW